MATCDDTSDYPRTDLEGTTSLAISDEDSPSTRPVLHILLAASVESDLADNLLPSLVKMADVELRFIEEMLLRGTETLKNLDSIDGGAWKTRRAQEQERNCVAAEFCEWADVLLLAPIDADSLAKMLCGMTGNSVLSVLRSWDTSKNVLLIPEMTVAMWENPMTKKQLSKIRRKWTWIQVMQPVLWQHQSTVNEVGLPWDGIEVLQEAVQNEINLLKTAREVNEQMKDTESKDLIQEDTSANILPPELWSIIFDYVGDWEVATSLGVYTNLPIPHEWLHHIPKTGRNATRTLEYTILRGSFNSIRCKLSSTPSPESLSHLAVKLIFKFSRTDILTYLSSNQKDIFWSTFGLTLLPTKASAVYGKPAILEWWHTSPAVLKKEYGPEAIDGASRAGFVPVLEWWRNSGLPLWYTERALESASAKGHMAVLEWWKNAAIAKPAPASDAPSPATPSTSPPLTLKVGKSILAAAQSGRSTTLAWWDTSGIPYAHEESVARIASTHGHVSVLTLWHQLKGSKMIFDNQVLVGATKNGHADVLEWWKRSGLRVEFKTCDIEEAMEDALGGGEERVRRWWEANGLNLGVGTSEWMKVKVL